jgi:hypothetical protein
MEENYHENQYLFSSIVTGIFHGSSYKAKAGEPRNDRQLSRRILLTIQICTTAFEQDAIGIGDGRFGFSSYCGFPLLVGGQTGQ